MEYYCPHCGSKLNLLRSYNQYYASLFKCPEKSYLNYIAFSDTRNIYPLLKLETGVAEALLNSQDKDVNLAFSRVKYIDYKTVSIVYFEQTLLKVYNNKEYQIIYPD